MSKHRSLARPVVPEVYRIAARSSGADTTVSKVPDASRARSSSVSWSPERVRTVASGRSAPTAAGLGGLQTMTRGSASPKKYPSWL
jgi:hypothetical protein